MHVVYESACVIDYCICWFLGEWFVCIEVLQMYVDLSEVVSYIDDANASAFITWFDDNGLVIFEVANC